MSWWNEPTAKDAFILSWISVVLTAGAAFAGIVFFTVTGSALCLVFGLENCVDFLSSVVVLWRFYCPGEITKAREEFLQKREKRASMAISFILVLLGVGVMAAAADDLSGGAEPNDELNVVLVIATVSVFIFGALTLVKFRYADKLSSASLYKDGQCSLIGTVLAIGLFSTTFIIEAAPNVWWLDPVFALVCGFVALIMGLHAIVVASCFQGLPIFSPHWWFVSQGDGMDEIAGRELGPEDFGEAGEGAVEMSSPKPMQNDKKLSEVV